MPEPRAFALPRMGPGQCPTVQFRRNVWSPTCRYLSSDTIAHLKYARCSGRSIRDSGPHALARSSPNGCNRPNMKRTAHTEIISPDALNSPICLLCRSRCCKRNGKGDGDRCLVPRSLGLKGMLAVCWDNSWPSRVTRSTTNYQEVNLGIRPHPAGWRLAYGRAEVYRSRFEMSGGRPVSRDNGSRRPNKTEQPRHRWRVRESEMRDKRVVFILSISKTAETFRRT